MTILSRLCTKKKKGFCLLQRNMKMLDIRLFIRTSCVKILEPMIQEIVLWPFKYGLHKVVVIRPYVVTPCLGKTFGPATMYFVIILQVRTKLMIRLKTPSIAPNTIRGTILFCISL